MYKKKVCMVGEFSVGKTSLVQRYVHSIFSEKYLTTVGVKIDRKEVDVDGEKIQLLLWDIQGEDAFSSVPMSYVKGTSAIILVVDGTRGYTLDTAFEIKSHIDEAVGDKIPCIVLFNKYDLLHQWEITEEDIAAVKAGGVLTMCTSSKDGSGVEDAFESISRMMMGKNALAAA